MATFDKRIPIPKSKWLVDNLVPLGKLGFVLAQAGVGKSFWVEGLATCVAYGQDFLDYDTIEGDVLIIDEDTPTPVLHQRLQKFGNYFDGEPKHNIFVESMEANYLKTGKLFETINNHPTVKLVVLDSLSTISAGLKMNNGSDMNILAELKAKCLRSDVTILITHHISEKRHIPYEELMTCDTHDLSMYSSVINQQADVYFVVGSPNAGGELKELSVRPVSKRALVRLMPFSCKMTEDESSAHWNSPKPVSIDPTATLPEIEKDILILFGELSEEYLTVKEVDAKMGGRYGVHAIRAGLDHLGREGLLNLSKGRSNLFRYHLPNGNNHEAVNNE